MIFSAKFIALILKRKGKYLLVSNRNIYTTYLPKIQPPIAIVFKVIFLGVPIILN